jgi:hypothetical protein
MGFALTEAIALFRSAVIKELHFVGDLRQQDGEEFNTPKALTNSNYC